MPTGASFVTLMLACRRPMGKAGCGSAVTHSRKLSCRVSALDSSCSTCSRQQCSAVQREWLVEGVQREWLVEGAAATQ